MLIQSLHVWLKKAKDQPRITVGVMIFLWLAITWLISIRFGTGWDWDHVFRPAAAAILSSESPYTIPGFFNPPWVLLPLIPLALLPFNISSAIIFVFYLLAFAYTAYRMGASPLVMVALVFSPHVLIGAFEGNVDFIAILGIIMPPQFGLFFVLTKPQIGAAIALYWLIEAWQIGRFKEIIRVFSPVTVAFIISFLVFGFWPLRMVGLWESPVNVSLFPYSLPIAFVLMGLAAQKKSLHYAVVSSPFFSPYVVGYSWPVAILGLVKHKWLALLAVAGLWGVEIFNGFSIINSWFLGKK